MIRHYEYTDAEGKRWSAAQNLPSGPRDSEASLLRTANKHLLHMKRVMGWKDVEVAHPSLPAHEVMKRMNKVQEGNNNPHIYDEDAIAEAQVAKEPVTITVFDKDGNPQTVHEKILATGPQIPIPPAPQNAMDLADGTITEIKPDSDPQPVVAKV